MTNPAKERPIGPRLLVVVGPTATGKTRLAIELGRRLGGEVVSADSVQVYRGFDVGSGKATSEERALCPHHLLDVRDANEPLEASQWAHLAREAIQEIQARGHLPIVCGGTFLWVRALLYGLADAPSGDRETRRRHEALVEQEGREALHARLLAVDPESARRLHPNDTVRVSRALEVFELAGEKLSAIQERHGFRTRLYDATLVGVQVAGEEYDARVRERVTRMLEGGLVDEVKRLIGQGYRNARAMDSVGYRQVRDAVESETDGSQAATTETSELLDAIVRATRVFARRQRTWLKTEPVRWIAPSVLADAAALDALARELA